MKEKILLILIILIGCISTKIYAENTKFKCCTSGNFYCPKYNANVPLYTCENFIVEDPRYCYFDGHKPFAVDDPLINLEKTIEWCDYDRMYKSGRLDKK